MIDKLELQNFKCFEELNMELRNLTVLSGMNGMGKSSVLQSILLLRQSADSIEHSQSVLLNGEYQELGVGADILFEDAEEDEIRIGYEEAGEKRSYCLQYAPEDEKLRLLGDERHRPFGETHIIYLSANRITPKSLYQITDKRFLKERAFDKLGEYTIQYLAAYGNDEVVENAAIVIHGEIEGNAYLANQTKEWLSLISPGVSPVISLNESARKAELKFKYQKGTEVSRDFKNINVGFGITYVLPIVVTLLTARAGDLILLENPEAHIHPKGQRILGEMIAAASCSGAQIVLETHSDHILNGIRLAVKKRHLSERAVGLYYFYLETEDPDHMYSHQYKQIFMDEDGMLSEWPEGFFDEWDNALTELLM